MPSAILYGSCFDANAGLFEALLGPDDLVLSDALNHASIIDGIRLCKAEKVRYAHGNMAELKDLLERASKTKGIKLIATDGVFSMDGDVARLDEICELAQRYGALVFVDDCHGTGVLGASGRGTSEHFGNLPIDIINSTLGKALGGASGGYTVASKSIVDLLRQRSRPYLFSNTLAPALVASASAAIDCVGPELLEKLRTNIQLFRQRMTEARLRVAGDPAHPIAPVMVGEAKAAATIASQMWNEGIYVVGFSYPVVPKGAARIRTQISAIHTADQIELAVEAFAKVAREHKLLQ